jgi:hypothetical protein
MFVINRLIYENESNHCDIKTLDVSHSDMSILISDDMTFMMMGNDDIEYSHRKIRGIKTANKISDCNKILVEHGYEELKKDNIEISDNLKVVQRSLCGYLRYGLTPSFVEKNEHIDEIKALLPEFINKIFSEV